MQSELEKLADKLASDGLLLNINKIKEANNGNGMERKNIVPEKEQTGQDINDGGEALSLFLNIDNDNIDNNKFHLRNHASVKELIAVRNEMIKTKAEQC